MKKEFNFTVNIADEENTKKKEINFCCFADDFDSAVRTVVDALDIGSINIKADKLNIDGLTPEELADLVDLVDKLENMVDNEINERVYFIITDNSDVFAKVEAEVIKLIPWAVKEFGVTTDDDAVNSLYNCDAVYMKAICNVLGDAVIPCECGEGMITTPPCKPKAGAKVFTVNNEKVFFVMEEYQNNLNLAVTEYSVNDLCENDVITTNFEFLGVQSLAYVERNKAAVYEKIGLLKRRGKTKPSGFNLYELCEFDIKKMYSSRAEAFNDFESVRDI